MAADAAGPIEAGSLLGSVAGRALPPAEARRLLATVLGVRRERLIAFPETPVSAEQAARFERLAARRLAGEPVAYLTGEREFYGLSLVCSPATLIPRPETELLVDLVLETLAPDSEATVLDLGTGTGAIALAIAHERPRARVCAVDSEKAALELARVNRDRLGLARVELVLSSWFSALADRRFERIVANPPYVAASDRHLGEGDVRYEPRSALVPGPDGLEALAAIVAGAPARLAPGGGLWVEHGSTQDASVRGLFIDAGFVGVQTRVDLAGLPRVTFGHRAPTSAGAPDRRA